MKICIPAFDNSANDSRICPHFGKAPFHLVYENRQPVAEHRKNLDPSAHCAPIDWMIAQGVTHVICLGIGDAAFRRLQAAGISVLNATDKHQINHVLSEDTLHDLAPFAPAKLCNHHDHN